MGNQAPMFASERSAAALLDMKPAEFRRLVSAGALPPPVRIGPHDRWNVAQIEAIIRGDAAKPSEDFKLSGVPCFSMA